MTDIANDTNGPMSDQERKAPDPSGVGRPVSQFPKQAVLVIHGIGEQIPMDTIRGFVRAVWETDSDTTDPEAPNPGEVWSRPDNRTGSLELRRITTRQTRTSPTFESGVRTDFFELYWADLSGGSTWDHVRDWITGLLLRNPFTRVPSSVFLAWLVLWAVALAVILLVVATILPANASVGSWNLWDHAPLSWLKEMQGWQLSAAAAAMSLAMHQFVMPYAGRIVRYTRASPDNIAARKAIRERGLSLLTDLHSADYDRIIVVGHSLGSILGYDLIAYFWASRMKARTIVEGTPEFDALRSLQKGINGLKSPVVGQDKAVIAYGRAQTALARLLRTRPKPKEEHSDRKKPDDASDARWLITDFVTLGSPLTHAEFLLANNKEALSRRQRDREFPTCPPFGEQLETAAVERAIAAGFELDEDNPGMIAFPFGRAGGWQLHHAAPFAAVRWTNIYDPALLVVCGDIVSGPLRPAFGQGITDVNLKELRGQRLAFSHTKYWTPTGAKATATPVHIRELRLALDLAGKTRLL